MFKFEFELDDADADVDQAQAQAHGTASDEEEGKHIAATAPFAEITLHQLVCTRIFFFLWYWRLNMV
jgi:hypothetical protein